jgi:hypothetical protein
LKALTGQPYLLLIFCSSSLDFTGSAFICPVCKHLHAHVIPYSTASNSHQGSAHFQSSHGEDLHPFEEQREALAPQ